MRAVRVVAVVRRREACRVLVGTVVAVAIVRAAVASQRLAAAVRAMMMAVVRAAMVAAAAVRMATVVVTVIASLTRMMSAAVTHERSDVFQYVLVVTLLGVRDATARCAVHWG